MWTWLTNLIIGKRDWELLSKERYPSTALNMFNNLRQQPNTKDFELNIPPDEFYEILILTFKCKLTGKIKVEKIRF